MITFILHFLFLSDMLLLCCSNENNTRKLDNGGFLPRVYNGWPAKLGDVPYQISFKRQLRRRRSTYYSFCGGVIIAPTKLLSAAHCFAEKAKFCNQLCGGSGTVNRKMLSHTVAVAGQLTNVAKYPQRDSVDEGQWRNLEGVRYPPQYSFPQLDFAIVFTIKPFKFNNYVGAIPYASKFVDYTGKCLVSGFGRTSPKNGSDKLLLAHLTLLPLRRCSAMHRKRMRHFVCTSSQYTDVGKGDSGGPLVCANTGDPKERSRGILVGIVSGHAYHVGSFFTRVSSFYKYVERDKSLSEYNVNLHLLFFLHLIHWKFLLF